jgi:hypothetical protein
MEVFMKSYILKKNLLLLCIPLMFLGYIYTQDASYLSDIIESDAISWEQASFLILAGGDFLPEDIKPRDAWDELLSTYWFSNVPERESRITVAEFCGIATKTLDYKGGLFYSLFKNNRYAFRDLRFKAIVPAHLDPQAKLKGLDALSITERLMEEVEKVALKNKEMEVSE